VATSISFLRLLSDRLRPFFRVPIDTARDSLESKLGRTIYEEFSTVVILKEQMRVTDAVWLDFLRHLRVGGVQKHHLVMLRTLIVGKERDVESANFEIPPWHDASLVTPCHAVRAQWNSAAVRKMCKDTGRRLFICSAEDTYQGRPLNLPEKYMLASHLGKRKNGRREMKMKDLPNFIELAIGMKVLVTSNIETDLDLANGARGEIVDVVLDPDEPPFGDTGEPIVDLQKMPAYTLVKLARTRATRLEGLDEHVIPIEPAQTTYRVKFELANHKFVQRTIRCRQFPMTGGFDEIGSRKC
jgi:hypothetical protein